MCHCRLICNVNSYHSKAETHYYLCRLKVILRDPRSSLCISYYIKRIKIVAINDDRGIRNLKISSISDYIKVRKGWPLFGFMFRSKHTCMLWNRRRIKSPENPGTRKSKPHHYPGAPGVKGSREENRHELPQRQLVGNCALFRSIEYSIRFIVSARCYQMPFSVCTSACTRFRTFL